MLVKGAVSGEKNENGKAEKRAMQMPQIKRKNAIRITWAIWQIYEWV